MRGAVSPSRWRLLAGLLYTPHRARRKPGVGARVDGLMARRRRRVIANAPPAKRALAGPIGLVIAEMRLIGSGWAFVCLALIAAAVAVFVPDFRRGGSAAGLLVLAFALSAHAGRSEARCLVSLTRVAAYSPMLRRTAFIVAGVVWSVALGLPAIVNHPPLEVVAIAAGTGAIAAVVAIGLSALNGSAFAARLVLLTIWYGYISF